MVSGIKYNKETIENISNFCLESHSSFSKPGRDIRFTTVNDNSQTVQIVVKGRSLNELINIVPEFPNVSKNMHFDYFANLINRNKFSCMHEIMLNLNTSAAYKNKYGKNLFIEKPLGFFIANKSLRGCRFVIFEEVAGVIPKERVNQNTLQRKKTLLENELNKIGLRNHADCKNTFDFLVVGTKESFEICIIDSENWELDTKPFTKI